jgi:hypothetical protein
MIHAQLSTLESASSGAKGNPNVSIRSLNGMSSGVVGSAHSAAIANVFEFRGLSPAPLAYSYVLMACRIVVKVVGSVTKTVMSSAYARTVVFRCRRPIFMLGSDSSRDRTRGTYLVDILALFHCGWQLVVQGCHLSGPTHDFGHT